MLNSDLTRTYLHSMQCICARGSSCVRQVQQLHVHVHVCAMLQGGKENISSYNVMCIYVH